MTSAIAATLSQAALWINEQLTETGSTYHICTTLDIDGEFGPRTLAAACDTLVAATPALRLRFGIEPVTGGVVQWFEHGSPEVIVLPRSTDPRSDPAVEAAVDTQVERPFRIDGGPLARFVVAPGAGHHKIALIAHHLTIDGPCQESVVRHLAAAVAGRCETRRESEYQDLVAAVRAEEMRGEEEYRGFWTDWLKDCESRGLFGGGSAGAAREAAQEHLPDPTPAHRFRIVVDTAPTGSTGSLLAVALRATATALRESGWTEPIVAVSASVRPRSARSPDPGEVPAGYFINLVPLLVTPDDDESSWREGMRRRAFPFSRLVAAARLRTDRPELRLDRVMLTYRRSRPRVRWTAGQAAFEADLGQTYRRSMTDVNVRVFHHADGLEFRVVLSASVAARFPGFSAALAAGLRENRSQE